MTLKMKVLAGLSAMMIGTCMLAGCGGNQKADKAGNDKMVLRYAEVHPQDYPTTKGAYEFAKQVKEKTNGRIEVEVYYGGQLGDEKSVIEQIQFGGIDFTRVSVSPLAEFAKELNVLQMPYLYRDASHMWKVLDGEIGQNLMKGLEKSNMVGLAYYDGGARNFYNSKREIKSVADMKGLKIRVQESALMMDMVKALGANPTPMAYGEVYSGMQTGVIDGAENNWPSYESASHFEVAKYFVVDEHNRVPELHLASKALMDKLSDADKKIIREAAQAGAKVEREEWLKREKASEEKVKAAGSIVSILTPEAKKQFEDAMKPFYEQHAKPYADIIEKIKAIK